MKARKANDVFWEKQINDDRSCRVHALNSFFGKAELTDEKFAALADEFDSQHGCCNMSRSFTHFVKGSSRMESVISHVVEKMDPGLKCVTILAEEEFHGKADLCVACFMFNNKHVWLEKKVSFQWWLIDSKSKGPVRIEGGPFEVVSNRGRIFVFCKCDL